MKDNEPTPISQRSIVDVWLSDLPSADRAAVYELTSTLSERSSTVTQEQFMLQYAMKKRDWKKDLSQIRTSPK